MQAGELELQEWKQDMAKKRSQGLFFRSLYQEKLGKPKRLVDSLDVFADPEASLHWLEQDQLCNSSNQQ